MDSVEKRKKSKGGFFKKLKRQWQLLVLSIPMLIYILIFNYSPMWGWITAFQDYKPKLGISGSKFVGWKNFEWLFKRPDFLQSIRNTLGMSIINLVFGTIAAIVLAVLLNEVRNTRFKRTVQTVTYLPHFLSMVIVVGMAQNIFASNGPLNQLLMNLHLIKEPIFFLGEEDAAVRDWPSADRCDRAKFAKFFWSMLDSGVYLPCSQFETMFTSVVHTDAIIDETVAAAEKAFRSL